mmetsp:Transcript_16748/g.53535  ORF Transcript_16748/g.53535 Transcript_16748/m.53535 type:complete len:207 (-) Transcript_16748:80-700(-)
MTVRGVHAQHSQQLERQVRRARGPRGESSCDGDHCRRGCHHALQALREVHERVEHGHERSQRLVQLRLVRHRRGRCARRGICANMLQLLVHLVRNHLEPIQVEELEQSVLECRAQTDRHLLQLPCTHRVARGQQLHRTLRVKATFRVPFRQLGLDHLPLLLWLQVQHRLSCRLRDSKLVQQRVKLGIQLLRRRQLHLDRLRCWSRD